MLKRILITLLIAGSLAPVFAQNNKMNNTYQKEWKQADSLNNRGLPKSAADIVRKILASAETSKRIIRI